MIRAGDNHTEDHQDQHYCAAYERYLYSLYERIQDSAMFIGEDKKANLPTRGNAVSKSTMVAINIDSSEQIARNDHSFGCCHGDTIAPNVVSFFTPGTVKDIRPKQGPVFVTLRDNETHSTGKLENILDLIHAVTSGGHFSHLEDGSIRPILFRQTDNATDVAPHNRLGHVLDWFAFKLLNLDALYHGAYAPKHSKFALCERTMSYLTHPLTTIRDLDRQLSGSHRESNGSLNSRKTYKENMILALRTLQKIFARVTIHGHKVQCEVVSPGVVEQLPYLKEFPAKLWDHFEMYFQKRLELIPIESRVQIEEILAKIESHSVKGNGLYVFGLVKCNDPSCCSAKRTSILTEILGKFDLFIPAPIPDENNVGHFLDFTDRLLINGNFLDEHCPSVMEYEKHPKVCNQCGRGCHSIVEYEQHKRISHPTARQETNINLRRDQAHGEPGKLVKINKTVLENHSQSKLFDSLTKNTVTLERHTKQLRTVTNRFKK
jgi:hypothetical protein